jgi:hypothetical protein
MVVLARRASLAHCALELKIVKKLRIRKRHVKWLRTSINNRPLESSNLWLL